VIVIFEEKGTRESYLQNSYEHLKTIKLTSIESKREVATLSTNYDHLLRMTLWMPFVSYDNILQRRKKAQNEKKSVFLIWNKKVYWITVNFYYFFWDFDIFF
jgi:hypothetical protein